MNFIILLLALLQPSAVKADFVALRTVPMVSGQLRSEGHMEVSDTMLLWEVTGKDGYVFKVESGEASVVENGAERVLDGPLYDRIAALASSGSMFSIDPRVFETVVTDSRDGIETVEARPKRRDLASVITKIIIVRKGYEVSEVNVFAASGAVTRVVFSNVELIYD